MKRVFISAIAVIAMLIGAGAPVAESVALAAQKKCSCPAKPAIKRRTRASARSTARTRAVTKKAVAQQPIAAVDANAEAEVVGPVFVTYTMPQNQYLRLRMNQSLNSATSRRGDRFQTTVVTPVYVGGVEVIPAGSVVEGTVTSVTSARTRGREGELAVAFDTIILPDGTRTPVEGSLTQLQDERSSEIDEENRVSGRSKETEQIIFIGGGGAGGAVLGGAIGGAKGAAIGAIIGAGAGVAGTLIKKGNEAEVRSGTEIGMVTTQPVTFSVRSNTRDR